MANRWFQQFFYSLNHSPVFLEGNAVIGSTGAVGTVKGSGLKSVTRLGVGTYRLLPEDGYPRYLGGHVGFVSPTTGSNVNDGSFVAGTSYVITAVGTTNWHAVGVPAGVTPAVGVGFVATGVGGAGSGTVKAVGASGIYAVEIVGDPQLQVNQAGGGVIIQCLNASGAPTDPASGSVLGFVMFLRNSTVKGKGE